MNFYKKYCANTWVAATQDEFEKGDYITLTTKRGKENEHIVWNFLGKDRDGNNLYSITRADGYNLQERAKAKAERYAQWAESRKERAEERYEASKEAADFLSLAEPIKIGHHSEKAHRALIERNRKRMDKAVEHWDKEEEHRQKSAYWESRAGEINLSIPESLEYYQHELEKAEIIKAKLKAMKKAERPHAYSLAYANKAVKELQKKVALAEKLWA